MRLIDADALIKNIEGNRNCSDMPSQWIDGVNYAIDLIELYEPTIDLVRCKECKHCVERDDTDGNVPYWICVEWDSGTDADGYCSYGERRE